MDKAIHTAHIRYCDVKDLKFTSPDQVDPSYDDQDKKAMFDCTT